MRCEMCGRETDSLFKTKVDEAEMTVCEGCSSFGKVLRKIEIEPEEIEERLETTFVRKEIIEGIVPEYSQIIRKAREGMGLDQQKFAAKISEKISIVHKMETGKFEPTLKLAEKLERLLGVCLIEETTEIQQSTPIKGSGQEEQEMTLGDMIKRRKS